MMTKIILYSIYKRYKFLKKLAEKKLKFLYFCKENDKNFNNSDLIILYEKKILFFDSYINFYEELKVGKLFCWHSWIFLDDDFLGGEKLQCQKCKKIKYY